MPVTSLQAAIVAVIVTAVGLVAGFGVIDNETAGILTGAAATLVGAIFVIANAVIHSGVTKATGSDATAR